LNLLNALYGLFVLPESHAKENRRPFNWQRINPLASLGVLKRFPIVLGLTATLALERLAHDALPGTWALYTTYRFNWSVRDIGLSLAVVGVSFAFVQGALTGPLVKRVGERRALIFGLIVGSMAFLLYGLATAGWMMYAIIIAASIGGIGGPSLQSLITQNVPATEQGAVQGALGSVQGLAAIFGPLMATSLFGYFTSSAAPVKLPGAAFLAASLLVALGVANALRVLRQVRVPVESASVS
ncbi:MAG TPA: MFS transporter, partial [Blastocatellia bacterium]|nr:MFS transporter [Blastocatellia bacterium]